jgi:predicted TIM-barrel fold metal-dependent hydrolase
VKAVGPRKIRPRKIMYATDYPYWPTELDFYLTGDRRWGVVADDSFFLNDEEKQLILAGNAESFANFEM